MVSFENIKEILNKSKIMGYDNGFLTLELQFEQEVFDLAFKRSEQYLLEPQYEVELNSKIYKRNFHAWSDSPSMLQSGGVKYFIVSMNLDRLRGQIEVFYDEKELVANRPLAGNRFILISSTTNEGKCTICPDDYNRNEILRYFQVSKIWKILTDCSDGESGRELLFLSKNKLYLDLNYKFEDLAYEFDGFSSFEKLFSDLLHEQEKKHILQNVLFSFLWRVKKEDRLSKILTDFTLFSRIFQENYLSFTVGFSFEKIRKEYQEKFRDYLSKLNSIMYDTLTRSLAIPISGIISFAAMGKLDNVNSWVLNMAAIVLSLYTTFTIYYLTNYQKVLVQECQSEYSVLFRTMRDELKKLELTELNKKENALDSQCNTLYKIFGLVSALSFSNLILNCTMFISSFLK
ncbi:hypothetical protein D6T51_08050 [Salmonella enterica subsp. enterica serovar Muenchen]|uniref:Uncharacterized protein n=2 Tax=Enterobacteriaceae TaxID=543 RepID=A0A726Y047_SALET|nr:hypothetical protein [Salmonella enterica]EBS1324081.1 hypothetical protein [Salmonella enterica subsp. enterica serovar Muenchen]EBX9170958.1 hypothetical protein [Salmonella enterica subsp. enterica serovar Kandla]ECD5428218.1 hypothetical protein [Salmonella enterica subsp. enterica serovar Denver]MJY55655.1 hypothetical protein [Salmonella enterica subsp. enterica serovar Milwaukee]HAE1794704.1 hypothetical protein [Salmonella enterica subsp. enterica serovar Ank]